MTDDDLDESFGFYDGECQVCGLFGRVDDIRLCEECAGKLDRDLICLRDWDYSVTAFGVPASKLEEIRGQVVAQYGEELELIAPKEIIPKKKRSLRVGHMSLVSGKRVSGKYITKISFPLKNAQVSVTLQVACATCFSGT